MRHNKETIGATIVVCAIFFLIIIGIEQCDRRMHSEYIGKEVILARDTFKIVDWKNTRYSKGYVLSNGYVVDEAVIENAEIVK